MIQLSNTGPNIMLLTPGAQTNSKGRYRVSGLPEGPLNLSLIASDGRTKNVENVELDRDNADFVLEDENGVVFVGHVVDWKTKQPIKNFRITNSISMRNEPRLDPEKPGEFRISGFVMHTTLSLKIEAESYPPLQDYKIFVEVYKDAPSIVERTFELGPGGEIMGRIVNSRNGQPLADTDILLFGVTEDERMTRLLESRNSVLQTAKSGADGHFRLSGVAPGTNHLIVKPPVPFGARAMSVEVKHAAVSDMGDVAIGTGAVLRGRVVRTPNRSPVPGVKFIVLKETAPASQHDLTTDENGKFELSALAAGEYRIWNQQYGISASYELEDGKIEDAEFALGGATVRTRVFMRGHPARANISLSQGDKDQRRSAKMDADGVFVANDLPAGTWCVRASNQTELYISAETEVNIGEGRVAEVTLKFPGGRLWGKVVSASGDPVERAILQVVPVTATGLGEPIKRGRFIVSASDGAFSIEGLPSGVYQVSATKEGLGTATSDDAFVPEDADSSEILLKFQNQNPTNP